MLALHFIVYGTLFSESLALGKTGILIGLSAHFTDDEMEAKGHGGGGLPRSHGELVAW